MAAPLADQDRVALVLMHEPPELVPHRGQVVGEVGVRHVVVVAMAVQVRREHDAVGHREHDRIVSVADEILTPPAAVRAAVALAPLAGVALDDDQPPLAVREHVIAQPLRRVVPVVGTVAGAPERLPRLVEEVGHDHVGRAAISLGELFPRAEDLGLVVVVARVRAAPQAVVGLRMRRSVDVERHHDARRGELGDDVVEHSEGLHVLVLTAHPRVSHPAVGGNERSRERQPHEVHVELHEPRHVLVRREPLQVVRAAVGLEARPVGSLEEELDSGGAAYLGRLGPDGAGVSG